MRLILKLTDSECGLVRLQVVISRSLNRAIDAGEGERNRASK